jgi:hypothetical protein
MPELTSLFRDAFEQYATGKRRPARASPGLVLGCGLVQGYGGANESLQRLLVYLLALVEVDGTSVFPSRLELNRPEGSFRAAPLAKVIFTTFL